MSSDSSDYDKESSSSDEDMEHTNNLELTGEILRDYNIICELGRGSYSIVWLAFNIVDNKFYALKVQDPKEYKAGVEEIKFVQKLPKQPNVFNNIIDSFMEIRGNVPNHKKYLCSVWNLHCGNIDGLLRKGNYKHGLPLLLVKRIMKQLITAVEILHKKFRVFHGDIKTDNILIKGLNAKDEFIINSYMKEQFFEKYSAAKDNYISKKGQIEMKDKLMIRTIVHKKITNTVLELYENSGISKYTIDNKYIDNIEISLADFGTHCNEDNHYDSPFGTR
jgi:serine/threonine protein kinase